MLGHLFARAAFLPHCQQEGGGVWVKRNLEGLAKFVHLEKLSLYANKWTIPIDPFNIHFPRLSSLELLGENNRDTFQLLNLPALKTLQIGHLDCDTRQSLDGEGRLLPEQSLLLEELDFYFGKGGVTLGLIRPIMVRLPNLQHLELREETGNASFGLTDRGIELLARSLQNLESLKILHEGDRVWGQETNIVLAGLSSLAAH